MQPFLGGPRSALSLADVVESLSLTRGAQVRHGVDVLNTSDIPTGEVLPFTDGSVTWSYRPPDVLDGQSVAVTQVRRQATLNVTGTLAFNLYARRFRLWTQFRLQSGGWATWYLGVFATTTPTTNDDGNVLTQALTLADKTYLWSQTTLNDPINLASSTVAVTWVTGDLGTRFGETRFNVVPSVATVGGNGLTFDAGTDMLTVYSAVLAAIGYDQLITDETGAAFSQPLTNVSLKGVETTYGAGAGKIVVAGSIDPLEPNIPNVIRFVSRQGPASGGTEGNGIYTVTNAATGPASVASRGFTVSTTVQVDAVTQATLVAVGDSEKQRYFSGGGQRFTGDVGLNPRHSDRDVVSIVLPRLGLDATAAWLVTSWTYPLAPITQSSDALMPITAEMRVT